MDTPTRDSKNEDRLVGIIDRLCDLLAELEADPFKVSRAIGSEPLLEESDLDRDLRRPEKHGGGLWRSVPTTTLVKHLDLMAERLERWDDRMAAKLAATSMRRIVFEASFVELPVSTPEETERPHERVTDNLRNRL